MHSVIPKVTRPPSQRSSATGASHDRKDRGRHASSKMSFISLALRSGRSGTPGVCRTWEIRCAKNQRRGL